MKHSKNEGIFYRLYLSYIPNKRDNIQQIIIKLFFLIAVTIIISAAVYLTNYFLTANKQEKLISGSQSIWDSQATEYIINEDGTKEKVPAKSAVELLTEENSDFAGWIKINNTKINNPIYQTDNNDFYLNHNQKKQKSIYGALYFDKNDKIDRKRTDNNLVIYGHHMKNGTMFGSLEKYKSLSFYKQHPTIEFSTKYKTSTYKIYSVFVLNASKADDLNYIYNISRDKFINDYDFEFWSEEAYERSLINTGVDVKRNDRIITLVTCTYDFDNARLVVMARETRPGENETVDVSKAVTNPAPKYPKRWYDDRKLKYPFE